jgi:hypothetical protein
MLCIYRAGGGYSGEGVVARIDHLGLGEGGEDGSGVEEGLEEDKDEGSRQDEREASVNRFLSLSGALAQLDALLKALSLHESFSPEDKQALLFAFTCPVCDTPSSACTTTSDQIRAVHDAFRLIDADGDMVITITDLRDIKTWASDGCGTGLYLYYYYYYYYYYYIFDMVITITDLRDIKTGASDSCDTGLGFRL